MKPKPLYSSLTFWSGILVMAFVCWAWWDSMRNLTGLSCSRVYIKQSGGAMGLGIDTTSGGTYWGAERRESRSELIFRKDPGRFVFRRHVPPRPISPWPRPVFFPSASLGMLLPHWLLLLLAALTWSAMLLWRARRHRRAPQDAVVPSQIRNPRSEI